MAGGYEITGPGVEGREVAGESLALSLAQNYAVRGEPGTWYVRADGKVAFHVIRHESGVVTTQRVNGHA